MAKREYITVRKDESRYESLINGRSDDGRLALPVESLSMRAESPWATFELIPETETSKPSRPYVILLGIRPLYLSLTLASPVFCMSEMLKRGTVAELLLPISILLSLVFLHFSMFLFNDYKDHLKGVDLNQAGKKQGIIKRGWATAKEVRMWAYVNFSLGAIAAIPSLLHRPIFVLEMGVIVVLTFAAVTGLKSKLGRIGINEFLVSLTLGPLLAYGFSETVYGEFSWFSLSLCIVFGWISSLVFQCKYLEEMVYTYQNRRETLIGRLGFDRSKKFVMLQLIGLPLLCLAVALSFHELFVAAVMTVCLLAVAVWFYLILRSAPSPMSSKLANLSQKMAVSHLLVGLAVNLSLLGLAWQ